MANFNTAIKANEEALHSDGSALKENEKYMESIQARIQAVKNELQEMILKSDLDKFIKKFLELSQTVLKFQNAIGGLEPLLVLIAGILITFNLDKIIVNLNKIFGLLRTDVLEKVLFSLTDFDMALKSLANGQRVVIGTTESATVATEGYTMALSSLQLVTGLVTVAITILISVINAYNSAQEARIRESKEALDNEKDQIKKISELVDEINSENLSRETLNDIISKNLQQYEEEISKIDDLNEARKRSLELIDEERKIKAEQIQASASTTYEKYLKQLEKGNYGKFSFKDIFKASSEFNAIKISNLIKGDTEETLKTLEEFINNYNSSIYYKTTGLTKDELSDVYNYIKEQSEDAQTFIDNFNESLKQLGYTYEDVSGKGKDFKLISIEDAITSGSGSYGKGNAEEIFKEIQKVKEEYKLTDEEAIIVKNNLKKYGYDVEKTVQELQLGTVKQAKEAQDELNAFVEVFGLTEEQQAQILENLADYDYDIGATMEALGIDPEKLSDWEEYSELTEKAQATLKELGIEEKNLQKEIGMSSNELVKQAEAWNISGAGLYNYLKKLNEFDESMDNVQSAYATLTSAVDEYNVNNGFTIDTMQTLLRLNPEYLSLLEEENGVMKINEEALKNKVIEQVQEAKQTVYNMGIKKLDALINGENKDTINDSSDATVEYTGIIDGNTFSLQGNTQAVYQNLLARTKNSSKLKEDAEQISKEIQEAIDIIDKTVNLTTKDFAAGMKGATNSTKETNSALKEQNSLLQQQKQELEDKKKQYDTVVSYIKKKIQGEIDKLKDQKKAEVDAIKDKIDAIKDEKEAESDKIDEQIDKLKEQQEIEEEYWQKKIDALKEQNDELETQLEYEELLENLAKAKAKRVRVYKEGQGFVYTEDTNEIDKAQAKLDEFNRKQSYEKQLKELEDFKKKSKENYEKQIDDLEKLKKDKEKNYDEQIKKLEEQQKAIEDSYDAQIKYFQDYLDKFTEETDAYENQQNRLLALQLTGIDFEAQGWQTRLDNLADFVEKYNALLGDIHTLDSVVDTGSTTDVTKTDDTSKEEEKKKAVDKIKESTKKYVINNRDLADQISKNKYKDTTKYEPYTDNTNKNKIGSKAGMPSTRATGDSYIKEDGAYLVGDSPNQELVLGSKINGSLVNLQKGSGVVNATSTNTLAGILNQLGSMGSVVNTSNTSNKNTTISIGNISLPNVSNGRDFVDYLQNFSLQMTQEAFA